MDQALLDYCATPGQVTDISPFADFIAWLTDDVRAITQVVQGLLIHDSWLSHYGIDYRRERTYATQIAYMTDLLDKALELDARSLAIPRSPERRVICCCREFATLLCAILRHKGVPARSRCGFATYFSGGSTYEDHWVCEYYHPSQRRWVRVDPQIDPLQQSILQMTADPLDLSPEDFITGGEAWRLCRSGAVAAERFGIGADPQRWGLDSLYGLWFVRGQLLRDVAALNKVETVPFLVRLAHGQSWAPWRLVGADDADITAKDLALLEEAAGVSASADTLTTITGLYAAHPDLQPPGEILAR